MTRRVKVDLIGGYQSATLIDNAFNTIREVCRLPEPPVPAFVDGQVL
jgi:hypothetical protein